MVHCYIISYEILSFYSELNSPIHFQDIEMPWNSSESLSLCSTEERKSYGYSEQIMREFLFRLNYFLQCVCVNLTLHHQLQVEGFRFVLRLLIHQAGDILSVFSRCRDHPILALHGHCAVHLGHWSVVIAASDSCNPGDCCLWFPLGCLTSCHDNLRRAGLHWDGGSWVFGFSWWREKKI